MVVGAQHAVVGVAGLHATLELLQAAFVDGAEGLDLHETYLPSVAADRYGLASMLGLPDTVTACLFDLDGVLTQTAKVHAAAWKKMFDAYLEKRARERGEEVVPFDAVHEYDEYV